MLEQVLDIALQICEHPNVWTDGSIVLDEVSGVGSTLVFLGVGGVLVGGVISMILVLLVVWLNPVEVFALCLFLFRLFREQSFVVILALQASTAVHLGVDNLNAVRHVARLLDSFRSFCPAELLNDGDPIMLIDGVLEQRGRDTVRLTKVNGHADEEMVRVGQVRELHRLGNNAADEAADFGRRRVDPAFIY